MAFAVLDWGSDERSEYARDLIEIILPYTGGVWSLNLGQLCTENGHVS